MESQAEVVVAAEALRAWVRGRRDAWATPDVIPTPAPLALVSLPPRALPTPNADPAPSIPARLPETPSLWEFPQPATARSSVIAADLTAAASLSLGERTETASEDVDPSPSFFGRTSVRAAIGLAAAAAVVAGVLLTRSRLGWPGSSPKVGTASLTSVPPGAQVLVDGQPVGSTPLRMELPAGSHAVEFRLKTATRRQTLAIAKGLETSVNIDWNARRFGGLSVSSTPTAAKVLIDGRERGVTPLRLDDLVVGSHTVQIDSSEGSVRRKVDITQGKVESVVESIYPGWVHVSAPIEVTIVDGTRGIQLDDSNRAMLKPGARTIRVENRKLGFSETKQVTIEPGGTANISVDPQPSTLAVTGSVGAEVYVDGTKVGETPLSDYSLILGSHDVMVVDRSGATRHATVLVTTQPAQLDISFSTP